MSKRDIIKLAVIALVLLLCVQLFGRIDQTQENEESQLVRNAIKDAVLTCYAVEGAYPDDLEYLREHYQLAYDEDRYFVTYESFASNHLPDIWVTERGAKMQ